MLATPFDALGRTLFLSKRALTEARKRIQFRFARHSPTIAIVVQMQMRLYSL